MPFKNPKRERSQGKECDGVRKILLKHMMADGRDCWLAWTTDFSKRELLLHVDFLSPALLVDFLENLPRIDKRFGSVRNLDLVKMSKSFNIKVIVTNEGHEVPYKLNAYRRMVLNKIADQTQIDLQPLSGLSQGGCVGGIEAYCRGSRASPK